MEDLIFSIIEKEPKTFKEIKKILNKKTLVIAFQRRFRQELVNGIIDLECLLISQNLAKKLV